MLKRFATIRTRDNRGLKLMDVYQLQIAEIWTGMGIQEYRTSLEYLAIKREKKTSNDKRVAGGEPPFSFQLFPLQSTWCEQVRKALKATQRTVVLSSEAKDTEVVDEVINQGWGWGEELDGEVEKLREASNDGAKVWGYGFGDGRIGRFRQAQRGASRSLWSTVTPEW